MSYLHETHVCRDCGAEITLPFVSQPAPSKGLREALEAATNGGDWRVRRGHGPDSFQRKGYCYVQFGPSEKKAAGLGTDQLRPEDARLIVAAVDYVRAALARQHAPSEGLRER